MNDECTNPRKLYDTKLRLQHTTFEIGMSNQ